MADKWSNCFLATQPEDWPPFCFLRVRGKGYGPIPRLSPSPAFAVAVAVASQILSGSKLNLRACTSDYSYEEGDLRGECLHPFRDPRKSSGIEEPLCTPFLLPLSSTFGMFGNIGTSMFFLLDFEDAASYMIRLLFKYWKKNKTSFHHSWSGIPLSVHF